MPLVDQDEEHLKILSIAYYVMAGTIVFGALFGLLYVVLGIVFTISPPPTRPGDQSATFMGPFLAALGGAFTLLGSAFALCTYLAGRYLRRKEHRTFCFVVAGLNCLWVPIGTALGVFTILVLQRPAVARLFSGSVAPPALPLGTGSQT